MNASRPSLSNRSLLIHDPQIRRTQNILIVLLGACLVKDFYIFHSPNRKPIIFSHLGSLSDRSDLRHF